MSLEQLECPACGAPVSIPAGGGQVACSYCRVTLRLQHNEGEAALLPVGQVTGAIADAGAQTKAAIGESMAVTRDELRRMQQTQELAGLELRLATLQGEIRSLQRLPSSKVTAQQLRQLRQQETGLQTRIAELQAALNPAPASGIQNVAQRNSRKDAKVSASDGTVKHRGCLGWALLVVAWFFFWPFLLPWTMIRSQSKPVRIAGYIVAVVFAFLFLVSLFAPSTPRAPAPEEPAAVAPAVFRGYAYDAGRQDKDVTWLLIHPEPTLSGSHPTYGA